MKFMVFYIWILTLLGALFYGHEIGYVSGQDYQRSISEVTICRPGYDFSDTKKAFE